MIYKQFQHSLQDVLDQLVSTQSENLDQVSQFAADAIAAGRFAFVFGTGHSFLASYDTYPRIGSYPGWLPIHEFSSSYLATLVGNQGVRQVLYLENLEGFGPVVLENYKTDPKDVMVVVSHSGVHAMSIDIALAAKEQGLKTVAITSVTQSKSSKVGHSGGKRLYEVCDVVIDTCVPAGDAVLDVPGVPHKTGAISSIVSCFVMQSLVAATAEVLASMGKAPTQMTRDRAMIDLAIDEHIQRVKDLYR